MVVRPSSLPRDSSNSTSSTNSNNSAMVFSNSPKSKQTNSMSRKHISVSPLRSVPRSKSMNGLSRIDANKINGNGASGRFKRDSSPLNHNNNNNNSHSHVINGENGTENGVRLVGKLSKGNE